MQYVINTSIASTVNISHAELYKNAFLSWKHFQLTDQLLTGFPVSPLAPLGPSLPPGATLQN
jgi:hypothetical protein